MEKIFCSKINDLLKKSSDGILAVSDFINLREQYEAKFYLSKIAPDINYMFYGGYDNAERNKLVILPEYYIKNDIYETIGTLLIKGSGYIELSHRDYLGAILSIGIERDVIGDIAVINENNAIIFVNSKIVPFIVSSLEKIGADKVMVCEYDVPSNFDYSRQYKEINDTIASARLDSVVSALINISREKAKTKIKSGNVELNFKIDLQCDTNVEKDDILSIHGDGRYMIKDINSKTRKDKIRLYALKYI